ncbi:MAG: XRE family transcriptional regulator [Bacteroidota bacterium]
MKSDDTLLKEIGDRFKYLRLKKGYSSYETFAIDNNLSRMQYWRIEKGITNLTIKSLNNLLHIHKMSIEDFFKIKVE